VLLAQAAALGLVRASDVTALRTLANVAAHWVQWIAVGAPDAVVPCTPAPTDWLSAAIGDRTDWA
jgi:hypothetical protein